MCCAPSTTPLPSPAPSPTRPSPHPRPHGSQRWRAMSRTACRCAPGLPGNASSSWRVPHIQTHQPSLMDRLQVRVRWCGLARLVRPSPLTPRHTYTHAPPSNTHTHIHTYTYTHTLTQGMPLASRERVDPAALPPLSGAPGHISHDPPRSEMACVSPPAPLPSSPILTRTRPPPAATPTCASPR